MPDAALQNRSASSKPADFLACAQAPYCARGAVLIQARPRDEAPLVRAGFTATKRIGGSVERNRAKRRLRKPHGCCFPSWRPPGFDYVFVARGGGDHPPLAAFA